MLQMRRVSWWFAPFVILWSFATLAQAAHHAAIRINAGGTSFTDIEGHFWQADTYFTGGISNSNSNLIQNTPLQSLYSTERVIEDGTTSFRYDIPLDSSSNGYYLVRLHFAEIRPYIQDIGQRVFHIKIQDREIWTNVDVFKEAGGVFQPLVKSHVIQLNDNNNTLSIELIKGMRRNPKLSGIEVLPATFDFYLNAGSQEPYTDNDGNTWQADNYFNTGTTYTIKRTIENTDKIPLYQTERYKFDTPHLQYNIPVPTVGDYYVTLHFSDNYKPRHFEGGRVFGIQLEGNTVANDIDLYKEVGGFTALQKSWLVEINDNTLDIEFLKIVQNPTIAAIEIHGFGDETSDQQQQQQPTPATQPFNVGSSPNDNMDFSPLYINAGSDISLNDGVNVWQEDTYHYGGSMGSTGRTITGTPFGELYQTFRQGNPFEYEIPIPNGSYQVTLHFAETEYEEEGARLFYVYVEGMPILKLLDLFKTVGRGASYVVNVPTMVQDGALSIEFVAVNGGEATLCAFSVTAADTNDDSNVGEFEPHYAHAVPGGPYFAVADSSGKATVEVDGFFSHTHLPGAWLVRWTWTVNDNVVGDNAHATSFELPAGEYKLVLEVEDSGNYTSDDYTSITVKEYGFPDIHWIWPTSGDIGGGNTLKIGGAGFNYSPEEIMVYIGSNELTENDLIIVGGTIEVKSVPPNSAGSVDVSVKTPYGRSISVPYTYIDETLPPIQFTSGVVDGMQSPTCLAFGPDGKLYVGTQLGRIVRLTLNDKYQVVDEYVSTVVEKSEDVKRTILGIAFDPTDTCEGDNGCTVYVTHSYLFHGELSSPNGKVSAVSGPNMDQLSHLITGLPVADHDHGVNGLVFGHEGELYIQTPGNTNAGVPGSLSKSREQKEELFSSATIVAVNVNSPNFDGHVTYDEYGNQKSGWDVSVFAPGQRNSLGIVLHSNGYLYATDNGANRGYGLSSVGCAEDGPSPDDPDELNVVIRDHYYGHPNRKRGEKDPRQCRYRATSETSDTDYTGPIATLPASSNGLCEFETEHFAGQLRGNLIVARWNGELYNVALTDDGLATETGPFDIPPVLIEEGGLDVVQGPDGTLFTARHLYSQVKFYSPDEYASTALKAKSVFPRRGPQNGGSTLAIYGDNLYTFGVPTVTVGGKDCPIDSPTGDGKITCTLPQGDEGVVDILVTAGMHTSVLTGGYRYVKPAPQARIERQGVAPVPTPSPVPTSPHLTSAPVSSRIEEDSSATTILASLGVRDLVWVNVDTGNDIRPVTAVCNNCFNLSIPVTIRADCWGDVNSVKMTLAGQVQYSGTLNYPPHALFRNDVRFDYQGMLFQKGNYTVTAQAFSKPDGQGPAGKVVSIDFKIK